MEGALATFEWADRINVSGPDIQLGPRATLSLSLLLHELGTNAVKYGAFSGPDGCVTVSWRLEKLEAEPEPDLVLTWRETGGPPVEAPKERGFGSRLIRMGLVGTGGVQLSYQASGFAAEMRAPLSQVQQS